VSFGSLPFFCDFSQKTFGFQQQLEQAAGRKKNRPKNKKRMH
jgi:hypothetical protein